MPMPEQEKALKVAMLAWLATCGRCDALLKGVMRGRPGALVALNDALKLREEQRIEVEKAGEPFES